MSPTPEGALIRRVRNSAKPRLTVTEAARRAGISAEMWGHIERGHRSGGQGAERVKVTAQAATLAHMADAVGVTPVGLEEAGRPDAAVILREMQGSDLQVMEVAVDRGVVLVPVPPDLSEADREEVRAIAANLAKYLSGRETKAE